MDEPYLYQQIAEQIRTEILSGKLKPGERLPSVRQLCARWNCTPGTVQRAYHELGQHGLLVSQAGKGTRVAGAITAADAQALPALRRASLVHRCEGFLLETLTAGYDLPAIQQAFELALDRWRVQVLEHEGRPAATTLRFAGSHDMVVNALAQRLGEWVPGAALTVSIRGSMGGLETLAAGQADLAGCHLWDAETDSYNLPYVRRLLPGKEVFVVTLAHRRLGLIVPPGNQDHIRQLADLARPGLRFVNRQPGSGTRVWLDAMLARLGIAAGQIEGYGDEKMTHSEVARAVAEGRAGAGLGLETAAVAYGLDFVFLTRERYDLVLLAETAGREPVRRLLDWLVSPEAKDFVNQFKGYEGAETGLKRSL
jgi:molybdate-binding protein/DNA-binding transcriptional regulator YhcF (GntR family)